MNKVNIISDPLPKLFRHIAIPSSIGMFFQTMYNVVDTYYAGMLNTEALAALSISFPVFFIILALSMGISQGSSALIANELGKKNKKKADLYTSQTLIFGIILGVVFTIISLFVVEPLFRLLGADGQYLIYALDYMKIILLGTPLFIISFSINGTLSAIGDMKAVRNALIGSFLLNIILDPLFMFGGLGIPPLGIKGIALATIIIEFFSVLYRFIIMKKYIHKFTFKFNKNLSLDLFKQAYPISLNRLLVSAGFFIITFFVSKFGASAVAAYGIALRIEQIMLLPSVGIGIATLTLVGQNNGAKKILRVKETYKLAIKYGLYISIVGGILLLLFGSFMIKIFTQNEEVINFANQYLKVAAFILFFYIMTFATISFYQGLKKPLVSFWIGLSRQIVIPLIFMPLAISFLGIWGIWFSMALTIFFSSIILHYMSKQTIKNLKISKKATD